ncbi:JmjC domain-containing protein [Streptomyces sp. NPDC002159]
MTHEDFRLAAWVGDLPDFVAGFWQVRPGVFRPDPGAVSPFGLPEIDGALATGMLRLPYFEMARAGHVVTPQSYSSSRNVAGTTYDGYADARKIASMLQTGHTLLLRNVEQWHDLTRDLTAELTAAFGRHVEAFFFVTPPGSQGLSLHRDDADVFVVQVSGSKTWFVHEGPEDDWNPDRIAEGHNPRQLLHTTLRAGEILYIPRAFAHRAVSDESLSAHLSLTIRDVAVKDVYRALQQEVIDEVRKLTQRPIGDAAIIHTTASMLDLIRVKFEALVPEDLVRAARRAQCTQLVQPPRELSLSKLAEDATSTFA